MPRKSLPKTIPKSPAKPKTRIRQSAKSASKTESTDSGMQYIDIYEKNAETEKKIRLLWMITIPITIILILFWFWLLKQNIASREQTGADTRDLRDDITRTMNEIRDNIGLNQAQNTGTASSTNDINDIKNRIIEQLQKNLDPSAWPSHDSEILAISLKYPPEWSQNEQNESIALSAPSLHSSASGSATSTDNTYSRILIDRKSVPAKTKLEDWLKKNGPSAEDYALASTAEITTIDEQKAITYQGKDSTPDDIDQIIYVLKGGFVYEIQINVLGRKTLDESYIKGIINNIKFL